MLEFKNGLTNKKNSKTIEKRTKPVNILSLYKFSCVVNYI